MAKMGRPRIDIDWDQFEKLCAMQCTEEEIAGFFGCTIDTINNRCKDHYGETFSDIFAQKRQLGKASLRRAQWTTALGRKGKAGNPTMQIWLGKNHLGQTDKTKTELSGEVGAPTLNVILATDDGPETPS
jgi:hypothetical protein